MDENLSIAYNDIDFCLKVMKLGYYNVYTPYAVLYIFGYKIGGYNDTEKNKISPNIEFDYLINKSGKTLDTDFAYNINLNNISDSLFSIKLPEEFICLIMP